LAGLASSELQFDEVAQCPAVKNCDPGSPIRKSVPSLT
jgi:hypothetical protein